MKFRRLSLRLFAIVLLIAAIPSLQAMELSSHHSINHLTHCCAFCHFAHLALANPAQAVGVLAPTACELLVDIHKCSYYAETLGALRHSRAPPA